MLLRILSSGLKTGAALSLATTSAIMAAGSRETGAPWSPINAISHIVDGDDVSQPSDFSPRESMLGLGINTAVMAAWSLMYEGALALTRKKSSPWIAAAAAGAAYAVDYKLVPARFTPGIEKKLSRGSIVGIYAILAATLALSPLWNDYDDTRSTEPPIAR
jgi:hypothetical protein